ncbi:MAG: hypothetical protein E7277_05005 [Lachnospiraceae bacterium]|nr:hypothetical protein [Lachnospiraceae bacterium]
MGKIREIAADYAQRDRENGQNHSNRSGLCPAKKKKWAKSEKSQWILPSVAGKVGKTSTIAFSFAQAPRGNGHRSQFSPFLLYF